MKGGAENRRKTIMAGGLGAVALCCVIYAYNALFGGSGPPPQPAAAPMANTAAAGASSTRRASSNNNGSNNSGGGNQLGLGAAPGVAAQKMASTSASLDPTLDESAMLRTESLVYSGTGRNIFSATYVPVVLPSNVPSARPRKGAAIVAPVVPQGPPPLPPINLKFFGTETRANGERQAFLLQGEDVYLAAQGDIVARKYRIVSISTNTIQVEDLVNNDTQTLPLQH